MEGFYLFKIYALEIALYSLLSVFAAGVFLQKFGRLISRLSESVGEDMMHLGQALTFGVTFFNEFLKDLEKERKVLNSVIEGVEKYKKIEGLLQNKDVTRMISEISKINGVSDELHKRVKEVTEV